MDCEREMGNMRFMIYHTSGYCFMVEGKTIEDIRFQAHEIIHSNYWKSYDCWSEEIK